MKRFKNAIGLLMAGVLSVLSLNVGVLANVPSGTQSLTEYGFTLSPFDTPLAYRTTVHNGQTPLVWELTVSTPEVVEFVDWQGQAVDSLTRRVAPAGSGNNNTFTFYPVEGYEWVRVHHFFEFDGEIPENEYMSQHNMYLSYHHLDLNGVFGAEASVAPDTEYAIIYIYYHGEVIEIKTFHSMIHNGWIYDYESVRIYYDETEQYVMGYGMNQFNFRAVIELAKYYLLPIGFDGLVLGYFNPEHAQAGRTFAEVVDEHTLFFRVSTGTTAPVTQTPATPVSDTTPSPAPTNEIGVTIDGVAQEFEIAPQLINDRTMLPLRAIGEALGMEVTFDSATNTAILTGNGLIVTHVIGTTDITANGVTSTFDVASVIISGRTLVPVRMLAEAIGADVEWDADTRTAVITTN